MIAFTSYNKAGFNLFERYLATCSVEDIQVRQTSNAMRVFCKGSVNGKRFNVELHSSDMQGSIIAELGHAIAKAVGDAV